MIATGVNKTHRRGPLFFYLLIRFPKQNRKRIQNQNKPANKKTVEPDLDGSVLLTIYTKGLRRCQ